MALVRGVPVRTIEDMYGVGYRSAQRHKEDCMSPALIRTFNAHEEGVERSVAEHARALLADAYALMQRAGDTGDLKMAMAAMENVRRTLRLIGDATGELGNNQPQTVINLATDPEWLETRQLILETLRRHPAALADVLYALEHRTPPELVELQR